MDQTEGLLVHQVGLFKSVFELRTVGRFAWRNTPARAAGDARIAAQGARRTAVKPSTENSKKRGPKAKDIVDLQRSTNQAAEHAKDFLRSLKIGIDKQT